MKKRILALSILSVSTLLFGCKSNQQGGEKIEPQPEPQEDNTVSVFILAGQSNMEGNTNTGPLINFCADAGKNYANYTKGYDSVQISFYNKYSNATCNYSNRTNPMSGRFVPTMAGQGVRTSAFGPELGIAEVLSAQEKITEDKPVFLIKYTSGGTGFGDQSRDGQNYCWRSPSSGKTGMLYDGLLEYTNNCLELIEAMDFTPVIKGFLWMQGESDSGSQTLADGYEKSLGNLISDFRQEYSSYALNQDGEEINFIDAMIQEDNVWRFYSKINAAKLNLSEKSEHNYLINTSSRSGGLDLKLNNNEHGGGDIYHYTVDSMIRLGNAFGQVIVDNNML